MINFYDLNIFHLLIYISFIKNILTEIYLLITINISLIYLMLFNTVIFFHRTNYSLTM